MPTTEGYNGSHTGQEIDAAISAVKQKETTWDLKVVTLTHSKSGTVHTLSGIPSISGIYTAQFKATADYSEGDTFSGSYTAKPVGSESTLPGNAFVTGDIVSITIDTSAKKLNFKVGGSGVNDTLPPQVTNFAAEAGNAQVTLTWDDVPAQWADGVLKDYVIVYKAGGIPTGVNDGAQVVVDYTSSGGSSGAGGGPAQD